MEMKNVTPLTPSSEWAEIIFKCEEHTIHDPKGPDKYNYTNV